jgi:CheY-like chemotaxis protein
MTRTILLADDSVTIQKVVELTFLDEDFRVVAFGDGSEAIARLQDVRPDVVIADVHMPGADGYEVAETVGRTLPGVPVLLLVGTFEIFDAARAQAVGASGHLKKPFDSQELLRRVQELATGTAPAPQPLAGWSAPESLPRAAASPAPAPMAHAPEPAAGGEGTIEFEPEPPPPTPEIPPPAGAGAWAAAASAPVAPLAPPPAAEPASAGAGDLSDAELERIARRVAELLADKVVREVAWEVVPDLAEVLLKARIRELEASVE